MGRDRSTSGADVSGGGDLDRIVFDELHNALGHVRFQKNLRDFFAEADAALSEMVGSDFLDDIPILQSRLHKLNGAAALFGLKSISERVGEIDELLQADSDEPLDRKFRQLRQHCVETRARVSELVSNEEH